MILEKSHKEATLAGGDGAFRELADAILIAQGKERVLATAEGFSEVMLNMAHQKNFV